MGLFSVDDKTPTDKSKYPNKLDKKIGLDTCIKGHRVKRCRGKIKKKEKKITDPYVTKDKKVWGKCPSCGRKTSKWDIGKTCNQRYCTKSGKKALNCNSG